MAKNLAAQAMGVVFAPTDGVNSRAPEEFTEYFLMFCEAFREAYPDRTFRVGDVMSWGTEYQRLRAASKKDFVLPDEFSNAYSMGRLLKRYQGPLGIECVGTYGNRAVYSITKEEPNE